MKEWICSECGKIGRINDNGTHECFDQACINFPYMTSFNHDAWKKKYPHLYKDE